MTSVLQILVLGLALVWGLAGGETAAVRTDLYGDPLPARAMARLGTVRLRHTGPPDVVGFTANGRQLLTFYYKDGFRVWDSATGKEIRRFGAPADREKGPFTHPHQVGLSADGRTLVEGGEDTIVRTWDVSSGRELHCFKLRGWNTPDNVSPFAQGPAFALVRPAMLAAACKGWALSPDGTTLAVWGRERFVRLLDVRTGKDLRHFEAPLNKPPPLPGGKENPSYEWDGPSFVTFLADGKTLVALDGEYAKGFKEETNDPMSIAVLTFWDVRTGKVLRQVKRPGQEYERLDEGLLCGRPFALSPDGKRLALPAEQAGERVGLALYDTGTGKRVGRLGSSRRCSFPHVLFSPDGSTLAAQNPDGTVCLWDTVKAAHRRLTNRAVFIHSLAFAPDGGTLAISNGQAVDLWDVRSGRACMAIIGHEDAVEGLAMRGDAGVASTHDWRTIRRWKIDSRPEAAFTLPDRSRIILLSPDGRTAVVQHDFFLPDPWYDVVCQLGFAGCITRLLAWDTGSGKLLPLSWKLALIPNEGTYAFSMDGRVLGWRDSREEQPQVRRWEAATAKELRSLKGAKYFLYPRTHTPVLVFTPSCRTLITASRWWESKKGSEEYRGIIRFWDLASGRQAFEFLMQDKYGPDNLIVSPDGRTLATLRDRTVELWEAATGKRRGRFEAPANYIAYAPDARAVAAGCVDGTVRVWDAYTCKELASLRGHEGEVRCVGWTADGNALVSGADDTTALVWDTVALLPRRRLMPLTNEVAEELWKSLAGEDAEKAYRAIVSLASSDKALPLLRQHLQPAAAINARQIKQLIADLDSDEFAVRRRAAEALEKLDFAAEDSLRHALADSPSPEVRRRAQHLLGRLGQRVPSGEELQALRAVEVLELVGTADAQRLLHSLACGGEHARLTQQAKDALHRLQSKPAPP
jgi:WD40 repeat protein